MFQALITFLMLINLSVVPSAAADFDEISLLSVAPLPMAKTGTVGPSVRASAALLMDLNSGTVLFSKNPHQSLPIASLTKIMTALIILENHDLDEVVTVENSYGDIEGAKLWFSRFEQLRLGDLLQAMLVRSANDAAMILADYHSRGDISAFVAEMNRKAGQLNLKNTRFQNPVGYDHDAQFSSAYDLALLTKRALRNPVFREIVRQEKGALKALNGGAAKPYQSTNYLLGSYLDIRGVKTGTTDAAGECLVSLARHTDGQHEVLAVLLNSPARFQENKMMIDWAWNGWNW